MPFSKTALSHNDLIMSHGSRIARQSLVGLMFWFFGELCSRWVWHGHQAGLLQALGLARACQPASLLSSWLLHGVEAWRSFGYLPARACMYSREVFDVMISETPCRFLTRIDRLYVDEWCGARVKHSEKKMTVQGHTHILCRGDDKADIEKLDLNYLPMSDRARRMASE